jgi:quinol monooxygenase YgiN
MIRVIIERRAEEGKVSELQRLILDLRAEGTREPGYVSGETLVGYGDRSLYVVISTWLSVQYWQAWADSRQRQELADEVEQLLSAPTRTTVLTLIERE